MKTIFTATIAALIVASGSWSASAGQDFRDAVRTGLVFHPVNAGVIFHRRAGEIFPQS